MTNPLVQSLQQTGSFRVPAAVAFSVQHPVAQSWCERNGYLRAQDGNIRITCTLENSHRLRYIEESRCVTEEKYSLITTREGETLCVLITAGGEHGLFHALNTLGQQLEQGEVALGEILDYPLFQKRGYIEGFYGKPWQTQQRLDMLDLMAKNKMNTYYYAPKDDPYHRDLWREPYPERQLADLAALVAAAQSRFMRLHYCIAPGLSMRYASETDYLALKEKLLQIYGVGVRCFGLLLDDIPHELQYEEDIARFGSETVHAHIYLGNRLFDDLKAFDSSIEMTLCPLQYHGKGDEYFISALGQGLDAGISLFWTGHNICSQELTIPEAIVFQRATRHKPLYWDNFPVNDAEMYNEMHLGYLHGRDAELYRYSEGLIANCMEFCECSKIPLLTVADYLWNPAAYDGTASWHRALKTVTGEDYEDFRILADHLLTSCLHVENSPFMNKSLAAAAQELRIGNPLDALQALGEYTQRVERCCKLVIGSEKPLYQELARWADKLQAAHEVLRLGLALMGGGEAETAQQLKDALYRYMRLPEVLTEFSLQSATEELLKIAEQGGLS